MEITGADPYQRANQTAYLQMYGRPLTGEATRKAPSNEARLRILEQQRSCCLYCGLPIGSTVQRDGKTITLRLNWDHFIPYVYAVSNRTDNWVAACHVCNGIKSARMFDTVMQAQEFIRTRWTEKGYEVVRGPIKIPEQSVRSEVPALSADDSDLGQEVDLTPLGRILIEKIRKNYRPIQRSALLGRKPSRAGLAALRELVETGTVYERDLGTHFLYSMALKPRKASTS